MFGALKPGFWSMATLTCSECCRWTLKRYERLRHRAVSLWQHGFLVNTALCDILYKRFRNTLTYLLTYKLRLYRRFRWFSLSLTTHMQKFRWLGGVMVRASPLRSSGAGCGFDSEWAAIKLPRSPQPSLPPHHCTYAEISTLRFQSKYDIAIRSFPINSGFLRKMFTYAAA